MGQSTNGRIVGVLLAAGEARRFGSPKQLAPVEGVALVRRSAQAIVDAGLSLFVVTGAHAEAVHHALDGLPLTLLHNALWRDGMGRSIACAMESVAETAVDGAMICLGDQPHVGAAQLRRLLDMHAQAPGGITAADHGSVIGPPCVFARRHFAALAQLRGPQGARALLTSYAADVLRVPMPEAGVDIDTLEQYRALQATKRS